jgi:hypothetical protein
MRISVDAINSCFLPALTTPPVSIADEEELFLSEEVQAWEILIWGLCSTLLPCGEHGRNSSGISNVLAEREFPVDM